ncbi:MAG: prolyl oligopeptidase family serine peptidase [Xanthomonadales bacterium]|nr:prolyl oligopeptidase family serine peptidase [Xanthomonadales bacterium]
MRRTALLLAALMALIPALARAALPDLEQIMEHPDWIGPPVEDAWWSLDGREALYRIKRAGSPLRDTRAINLRGERDAAVGDDRLAVLDGAAPVFDRDRRRALFLRNGDLFIRDLRSGRLTQLSRGVDGLAEPRFMADGRVLVRAGERWLIMDAATGMARPLIDLRMEDEPDSAGKDELLRQVQLRLFDTLARQRADRAAERSEDLRQRGVDSSRAPAPWFLGKGRRLVASEPSPNGRWLLIVTAAESAEAGERGKMPLYVTESGYTEIEEVRTRVGRNLPQGVQFELLDIQTRTRQPIDLGKLPGVAEDPLAFLREGNPAAPKAPEQRAVSLLGSRWNAEGSRLALMLRSVDNKDRWLVSMAPDVQGADLAVEDRLTDTAWIGWTFNDFGWLPDGRTLWFQSERSGFGHLYLKPVGTGAARALTQGRFEAQSPTLMADGRRFIFIGNAEQPTMFDLYEVAVDGGTPRRLTELRGVERYVVSPDQRRALVLHSSTHVPTQLAVLDLGSRSLRTLTDTRTAAYRAIEWPDMEVVAVPSSHQADAVWSKLYRPARMEPGRRYPIVLFVHGAGYLQNSHHRFPQYYREQMFHHLLVERGYLVLDMDFRASAGYGRDWRTAIYRRMGHPELEDLVDGLDWLVEHHQGDPERVGVYGGSYGGFMALMALFREPDRFHAGAALRPVTDWRHYNHGYTANILNTPDVDPEAHRISSPIEYAENLRGHLLIAHGMMDDNVFYQDAVMLAQRLIELRKEDWELASYPLERHGYVHPESWLDQYRRVLKLFERNLRGVH